MIVKVLSGHVSPETAYVVADYPYGFRLRCSIRYWLERDPKRGYRLCSQTTNPKVSATVWNKPKKSTYTMLAVMGLDEQGHVSWTGCSAYDFDKLEDFRAKFEPGFDGRQADDCELMIKAYAAHKARLASRENPVG